MNGGGRREVNYFSHLDHLRRVLALLEQSGVAASDIAVFSGDGSDPEADLATREVELRPDFWLLPRRLDGLLRPPVVFVDSRLEGVALRPARLEALRAWFQTEGRALAPGDALLLYVTDHGERIGGPAESTITLWGEKLSVGDLRELLALLDPGVRVVMLMSQCYSGGFADAALASGDAPLPSGGTCGYFSTTADRRANGCYPEISRKDSVGHSHRLLNALASGHPLRDAQREVLVTDDTPDVPLATSGLFLERRLARAAQDAGSALPSFADPLLAVAFAEPATIEPEIRLLDRVGAAYGFASPRSLAALEVQTRELSELSKRLETYAKLWEDALDSLREENLRAFRAANPEWGPRLEPGTLKALDADGRRRESDALLDGLASFTVASPERKERLEDLHWKTDESKAASYRAEVRLGVALRMRSLLLEIAGARFLATSGSDEEWDAFQRLATCEDLPIAGLAGAGGPDESPTRFPTLATERRTLERVMPGWLGIRYRPPQPGERRGRELPAGASVVVDVIPDGPAVEAGLAPGDILLGPPGEPFVERHAVREWTMLGEVGASRPLLVLRDEDEWEARIRLAPYPLQLPSLPGPPELGSPAPPLEVAFLRGATPPRPDEPRLLFFWATWCPSCKMALPELAAYSSERGVPIVAITDEDSRLVERFARLHAELAPLRIATDPRRIQFHHFGVSGTPTFVLIDAAGIVRHLQVGYDPRKGIGIAGWSWAGRAGSVTDAGDR